MKKSLKNIYPKTYPVGPGALDLERLDLILERELIDWKVMMSKLPENPFIARNELYREYRFENFKSVIKFINNVSKVCEALPHHPRWENTWTTLRVWLTTWDINHVISYKDIMLARQMDHIYLKFDFSKDESKHAKKSEEEKAAFAAEIQSLVIEDNLEVAFFKLNEYATLNSGSDIIKDLMVMNGNFNRVRKNDRKQLLTSDEANVAYAKFRDCILELIKDL
nr:4a-hydroxytetrahydrobiopterin dehydratase [uncultured Psychroserpens sp.]